jgi:hypothetical protein
MRVQFIMLGVIGLAGAACSDDASLAPQARSEAGVAVYEAGPRVAQCEPAALTPAQSAAKLEAAGVEVLRSGCGTRMGVMYPAVCGAGLAEIIVHDIPAGHLEAARAAGFGSVDDLDGWERTSCDDLARVVPAAPASAALPPVQ